MLTTDEILGNVIWLVNALDEDALVNVQDIPFLEIAQTVTIAPSRQRSSKVAQPALRQVRPRYPTSRSTMPMPQSGKNKRKETQVMTRIGQSAKR